MSPSPTTLSAAAGQTQMPVGGSKKTGFIVAGAAVVAIAGGAIFMVAKKGKSPEQPAGNGSDIAMNNGSATGSAMTVTPPHPDAAVAPPPVDAAAVPPPIDAAAVPAAVDAAVAKPDVALLKLDVDSTPQGAEIFLNAVDTGKKTPATLTVPKTNVKANIRLKLHGYVDGVINSVALDSGDSLKESVTLKVYTVQPPGGGGHTGGGKGSGKTGHQDDSGLERPE
jgi:hypothetical protein